MISFSAYVTEKRRLPNGIVIQNDDLVTPLRKPTFSRGQIRSQADIYRHWKKLKDTKGKTFADAWLSHVSGPSTTIRPTHGFSNAETRAEQELLKKPKKPKNKGNPEATQHYLKRIQAARNDSTKVDAIMTAAPIDPATARRNKRRRDLRKAKKS